MSGADAVRWMGLLAFGLFLCWATAWLSSGDHALLALPVGLLAALWTINVLAAPGRVRRNREARSHAPELDPA